MGTFIPILGTLLLAAALFFTLGLAAATSMYTMRPPSGPDAMGLAGLFFAAVGAWVLIVIAAGIAAARGSLGWIAPSTALASLLVVVAVIGLGALSVAGVCMSFERRYALRTPIGLAGGFVLPMIVIMFTAALLWLPPAEATAATWTRFFVFPLAVLSLGAWGGAAVLGMRHLSAVERHHAAEAADMERRHQRAVAEARERDAKHAAELAALPDDTPLPVFLTHLFIDKSEQHHARAMARIAALPDIRARIEAALADPTAIQREYCAHYVRHCAAPDTALAPAVAKAITLLARDIELAAADGQLNHARGMTEGILLTAEKFPDADFTVEVKQLRSSMEKWPHEGTRAKAIATIDRFLSGQPVEQPH